MIQFKKVEISIPFWAIFVMFSILQSVTSLASDHADPIAAKDPNANITGLFFYPDDDQMILILTVSPRLLSSEPYPLHDIEYAVFMDLDPRLEFDDPANFARYGGSILNSEAISADAAILIQLNDDASIKVKTVEGLLYPETIKFWSGVRDDPFILPRFFGKNVIAMAISIPMSSFPQAQQDWLVWGAIYSHGIQIDHVGRSNRSQLARFDYLNVLPPSEQVQATLERMGKQKKLTGFLQSYRETNALAGLLQYVFNIRDYDLTPDVMIYSKRFLPGFPNGRQLIDDVAALSCQFGDCVLQELSFIEGGWPRATQNDKPFEATFPYLAEPWPATSKEQARLPGILGWWVIYALVGSLASLVALYSWCFFRWGRRQGNKLPVRH